MNFDMWRGMIEHSLNIKYLVLKGWTFTHYYGEERLGVQDAMIFTKNGESVQISGEYGLNLFLRDVQEEPE